VFTQHEFDKWTSYQKVKKDIAKRKMAEAQERSKKEMLNSLEGEDVSHIDIDTDEGIYLLRNIIFFIGMKKYLNLLLLCPILAKAYEFLFFLRFGSNRKHGW
jgi:hypothetical protein